MGVLERVRRKREDPESLVSIEDREKDTFKEVVQACMWALDGCKGRMPEGVEGKVGFVREKLGRGTFACVVGVGGGRVGGGGGGGGDAGGGRGAGPLGGREKSRERRRSSVGGYQGGGWGGDMRGGDVRGGGAWQTGARDGWSDGATAGAGWR